jgi:conjugal transfer pilus assembly protein TraL
MQQIPFPRHIDAPQRFLFWTVDQMIPFATMALIGMATKTLMVCLVIGGVLGWALARYRDSRPDGYLQHMAYWYGVLPLKGRSAMNPFARTVFPL